MARVWINGLARTLDSRCPPEVVDLVYLATELAMFDEYLGLVIPRSMGLLAHVDMARVEELRTALAAAGHYKDRPAVDALRMGR
jgi:hypothetical protein